MLIYKNSFKKIKKSLGRFISLILIVALGSAFFSGIREASSDMIKTMDKYYDDTLLMDYKIVSTMGLTDDDVLSIKELSDDLIVIPTYSFDILVDGNVTRIHAIEEDVNKVNLVSGRMPNSKNECLVEDGKYTIGDKIKLEDNDYTNNNEFTVVGTITSSLYTYKNKGISSIGDGKLDTYINYSYRGYGYQTQAGNYLISPLNTNIPVEEFSIYAFVKYTPDITQEPEDFLTSDEGAKWFEVQIPRMTLETNTVHWITLAFDIKNLKVFTTEESALAPSLTRAKESPEKIKLKYPVRIICL